MIVREGPFDRRTALRRRGPIAVALAAALTAVGALAFGGSAQGAAEACTNNAQQGILCVSVSDTPDPVAYSAFDGNRTFLKYDIVAENRSRSASLSHVGVADTLPEGTTFVRATSSRGACSEAGGTVSCPVGALKKGQRASIEIIVTAPASEETNPADITISNTVSATFDERFNDQNGGKQDTATATETTLVSKTAGQTFVPLGHSGKVDTDPAQDQYANALIPSASADVLATLKVLDPDVFCVDGTVRIQSKSYICRSGGFVDASVVNADTGGSYRNTVHPLVFHLSWGPGLISDRQTVRNFVVFYRSDGTAPIQVIDTRCNAAATNTPCLRNVAPETDGGWSVDLVKADNGHMR
jgi:uncharacterized repeat protein (TIGR01451 family)